MDNPSKVFLISLQQCYHIFRNLSRIKKCRYFERWTALKRRGKKTVQVFSPFAAFLFSFKKIIGLQGRNGETI
jgi:hypothetical protein